jgi:predicted dehydrogenase
VSFGTSWDVFRHTPPPIELHGTEGSLRLPDPDTFGGTVSLSARGADWQDHVSDGEPCGAPNWPYDAPDRANYRMLGVADLVRALHEGRAPRASGDLALHVLEVMEAIMTAAQRRTAVQVPATEARPPLLGEDETRALLA